MLPKIVNYLQQTEIQKTYNLKQKKTDKTKQKQS